MKYELTRSSRKTLALQLKPDGTVLVRAPLRTPLRQIEAFLRQHWSWVEKKLALLPGRTRADKLSPEELAELKKRGRKVFPARAAYYAPLVGVRFQRIAVRSQKTKWGSCSSKGGLNFNCLLLLAPPEVLDYVVVHELCHLLEMNHSPRFWAEVRRVCPNCAAARKWLKDNGSALIARLPD